MAGSDKQALYRQLPGIDKLLADSRLSGEAAGFPRELVVRAAQLVLGELRDQIKNGTGFDEGIMKGRDAVVALVMDKLREISSPSLRHVINATGVIVHTNLGRSMLAGNVMKRLVEFSAGYSNLEYDLERGTRGSRYVHVEDILRELTSAEAAMVVNNNAAAVLLCLETLARDREVIVSRGQLVEIGGAFRIPDVMRKSGAVMVEVGTTNKTHLEDFEAVMGPDTAMILKVHTSNYQIVGFTKEVPMHELAGLGRKYGVPVMEDLGSGSFVDFTRYGLMPEPTVQDVLAQGADIVTFSGDKLLGGPQAGIILGRKDLVDAVKRNQFARALRIDKMTLLALEETLRLYRDKEKAIGDIPTLSMICTTYDSLVRKARRLVKLIGALDGDKFSIEIMDGNSRVGGGALPIQNMPTRLVCLVPAGISAHDMESRLRSFDPPVITRVEKDRVLLDVRTILDRELKIVAKAVQGLAG